MESKYITFEDFFCTVSAIAKGIGYNVKSIADNTPVETHYKPNPNFQAYLTHPDNTENELDIFYRGNSGREKFGSLYGKLPKDIKGNQKDKANCYTELNLVKNIKLILKDVNNFVESYVSRLEEETQWVENSNLYYTNKNVGLVDLMQSYPERLRMDAESRPVLDFPYDHSVYYLPKFEVPSYTPNGTNDLNVKNLSHEEMKQVMLLIHSFRKDRLK